MTNNNNKRMITSRTVERIQKPILYVTILLIESI